MHKKRLIGLATLLLLSALVLAAPAAAQEGGGYQETFDDATMPEWEHSPEAIVADGVLRMSPGNFALHFGDWSDITLTIKLRFSGEGEVWVNYYVRDAGKYGVQITPGTVTLQKEQQNQPPTQLGSAAVSAAQADTWINLKIVVSGGQHQVYVDDALQLTATDPEPLETGAVLLQAMGGATVEFDDLAVQGTAGGPPPGEIPPGEEPPAGEVPPGQEPLPGGELQPPLTPTPTVAAGGGTGGTQSLVDEFFASQASRLELGAFAINLVLAAICAFILGLVYIHWGASLTNRRKFAANFMLMTVTTTFIILVVRSSVALSLGLVGALSIVRFRTAVKEAEELAFLFFAIGLGIGLGDNQRLITLLALVGGVVIIGLVRLFRRSQADANLHLTVASRSPNKIGLEPIMTALQPHVSKLKLLRLDDTADVLEAAFLVEFKRVSNLNRAQAALKGLSESVEITFLDNQGIW